MADVLFVRELAAARDLVLAFAPDGRPAWGLDRENGLQWWYPGGDDPLVRNAIAESWDDFATMPITAASYAGPHPAVELAGRAERSSRAAAPATSRPTRSAGMWMPSNPWASRLDVALRRLPSAARLALSVGVALVVLARLPMVLGLLLGSGALTIATCGRLERRNCS